MQYELKGTEKQGKGPIVVCVDNSGSMSGDRETWSIVVALALLEIATMPKREFACIHIGGQSDALEIKWSRDKRAAIRCRNDPSINWHQPRKGKDMAHTALDQSVVFTEFEGMITGKYFEVSGNNTGRYLIVKTIAPIND